MRTIQLNKVYAVANEDGSSFTLVVCKRYHDVVNFGEDSWEDIEKRHVSNELASEIASQATQLGDKSLDKHLLVKDSEGNEYNIMYRNDILTKRMLYVLFAKFLSRPLSREEFAVKTNARIAL